jgi:hypothetical protein
MLLPWDIVSPAHGAAPISGKHFLVYDSGNRTGDYNTVNTRVRHCIWFSVSSNRTFKISTETSIHIVFFHTFLYINCTACNKCICSISTGSRMSCAQWRNSYNYFVHLGIILILLLGFYSGLSGRVGTVYLFNLCVVSLLSSRFIASAWVWFSNFLKYVVFHLFISLSTVFIWRSSWILWLSAKVRSECIGESWKQFILWIKFHMFLLLKLWVNGRIYEAVLSRIRKQRGFMSSAPNSIFYTIRAGLVYLRLHEQSTMVRAHSPHSPLS